LQIAHREKKGEPCPGRRRGETLSPDWEATEGKRGGRSLLEELGLERRRKNQKKGRSANRGLVTGRREEKVTPSRKKKKASLGFVQKRRKRRGE